MPSRRLPGILEPMGRPHGPIDPGTRCRAVSPRPGFLKNDGTARLGFGQKVIAALQLVPSHLPDAAAAEFQELLSTENLEILAAGFIVIAASHAAGAGFVADGVALGVGAFFLGWQVGDLANHFAGFVGLCATAQERGNLDRAADHMARAVLLFGMAAISAFLLHKGIRARGASAAEGVVAPGEKLVRVGRWMSQNEYDEMARTGMVQESPTGGKDVVFPPDPESFKAADPGSLYVEFDVPESSLKNKSQRQKQIPGTMGFHARLAASKGLPVAQMPKASNIKIKGRK